jgi:hypothetical protein
LRSLALSRGVENFIVQVRFPHRGSHIEQTRADTHAVIFHGRS